MALQIKRGVTAKVKAYTPRAGELVLDTTTSILYVGDGTTLGGTPVGGTPVGGTWTDYFQVTAASITTLTPGGTFARADVYLNGSMQTPGYSYTIASNVITFATAVSIGTMVYCKLYK